MDTNTIDYRAYMDRAFRGLVADVLAMVAQSGMPGEHHFFITFHTNHPGVSMPQWLLAEHPGTLTIVLQHEYYDLEVDDESFSVSLSFKNRPAHLRVPFEAIESFADPAAQFGLRFTLDDQAEEAPAQKEKAMPPREALADSEAKVIQLDAFRR